MDRLSAIVTGLHRVTSTVTGGARMENIWIERDSIEVRTPAFSLAINLGWDAETVRWFGSHRPP